MFAQLSGDSTTGHLAQDEFKRAVRYASNGIWKNQTPKRDMGRHPKYHYQQPWVCTDLYLARFAAKSCTDCDSGVYCRCPVHTSIVDQYSNAASPYSREKQPPSPTQQNFLAVCPLWHTPMLWGVYWRSLKGSSLPRILHLFSNLLVFWWAPRLPLRVLEPTHLLWARQLCMLDTPQLE